MYDSLINTKIFIPPKRIDLVHRVALLEKLGSLASMKLCLISAPAGFGKTTLISDWASQYDQPLIWYSLDEGDNDTDRFLMHLLSALEAIQPEFRLVESSTALRQAPGATPIKAILTILVNELNKLDESLVIVLDDYHQIANPEIDEIVSFLLDHSPEGIRIIVVSRTNPALPLARLRASAQLMEITEEDLRFSSEETLRFLQEVMGLELSEEHCLALDERTEGWVAGLQLAALSLEGREDPDEFIASLRGTHRYILDYLAEEVFSNLPEILQIFLLRISHLERFCSDLCNAVVDDLLQQEWNLGLEDSSEPQNLSSQQILEFLDDANLFVFPLDHERIWFRFHPLFSDFLQDRLESSSPDEIPGLHQRAADWFSTQGLLVEAIHHAHSAGNIDQAADLIAGQVKPMLVKGETSTLIRWLERLPSEALIKRPALDLAMAWSFMLDDPVRFLGDIPARLARLGTSFGVSEAEVVKKLNETEEGSPERDTLGEYLLLLAYLSREEGNLERTSSLFNTALEVLPEEDYFTRSFGLGGQASSYWRAGELVMAEALFKQAAESGRRSASAYAYIAPTDWEATVQAQSGRLNQATETYQKAIDHISALGSERLPLTGHAYVGLAGVLLEKNELEKAFAHAEEGVQRGELVNDTDALREGYVIKARVLAAMGDKGKSKAAMERGIEIAREIPGTACSREALAWAAVLNLLSGDVDSASNWASKRGLITPVDHEQIDAAQEIERRAFARLLLAQRKIEEAEIVLEGLLAFTEENGQGWTSIEVQALLSIAQHAGGNREGALQTLARALLLAEPEGFVRTFIDSGPMMAILLNSAKTQGHSPEYVKRLLNVFGEEISPEAPIEPLTERELDVLQLVAGGLTNAQIAAELVVAQSTVKTHINRIYSKLGVTQRTQAVAKAREMDLIR